MMPVSVTVDLSGIEDIFGEANTKAVLASLTDRVAEDSNMLVPVDTHNLHDTIIKDGAKGEITWPAPYANIVYNRDRLVSPAAGGGEAKPQWFEEAKRTKGEEWVELVADKLLGNHD